MTSSQATVTSSVTKTQVSTTVSTTSSVRNNDSSSPSNQITSNTLAMSVASVIAERILTPSPPVHNDTRTVHEYKYSYVPSIATELHCMQLNSINCNGTPLYTVEFYQLRQNPTVYALDIFLNMKSRMEDPFRLTMERSREQRSKSFYDS